MKKETEFFRYCPECNSKLYHANKETRKRAIKENKKCRSCCQKGKKLSEETKRKIGEKSKGHKLSDKAKNRISIANTGKKHTKEVIEKISNELKKLITVHKDNIIKRIHIHELDYYIKLGYEKGTSEVVKNKISIANTGKTRSDESKKKMSEKKKGITYSEEIRKKWSEQRKNRKAMNKNGINKWIKNEEVEKYLSDNWIFGFINKKSNKNRIWIFKEEIHKIIKKEDLEKFKNLGWTKGRTETYKLARRLMYKNNPEFWTKIPPLPNFNPYACKIFNCINDLFNWNGQHACNKGEKKVNRFFVDYYEPNLNLVIEFDEKHHFVRGNLKNKDIKRQQIIEEELDCTFLRINGRDLTNLKFY